MPGAEKGPQPRRPDFTEAGVIQNRAAGRNRSPDPSPDGAQARRRSWRNQGAWLSFVAWPHRRGSATVEPPPLTLRQQLTTVRWLLTGLFAMMLLVFLYFGRDVLMPIVLALLLALMLSPIVRLLRRRKVPEGVAAVVVTLGFAAGMLLIGFTISGPVATWLEDAPSIGKRIAHKLSSLRESFDVVLDASRQVEEAADTSSKDNTDRVVMAQPGLLVKAADSLASGFTTFGVTIVITLFFLASGSMFTEKIVHVMPLFRDKLRVLRVVRDIETEVSSYLLTVAMINAGLGVAVGCALWLAGMPNAFLWGGMAMVLNFLPYIGSMIGISLVALVSFVTFDSLGQALIPPLSYLAVTSVEGQFLTPAIVGRRLELNALSVMLAVLFWAWLWGIVGALIAVPL
ncbi:MAG TPA: AI-2E family transporter, partial [Rhodospirillum rubrum]|nr:AI-2E family transporter [Rhodospirillum rubrum]